jgi:hypothetical protein
MNRILRVGRPWLVGLWLAAQALPAQVQPAPAPTPPVPTQSPTFAQVAADGRQQL